jgi:hypothetical protein
MQKIIIKNIETDFEKEVNEHLANGWKVVPNTMQIQIQKFEGHFATEKYVVFLEKSESKPLNKNKKRLLKG